jgi:hypothetical protein
VKLRIVPVILAAVFIVTAYACKKKEEAVDDDTPQISSVSVTNKTSTSATLNWTGSDETTAASDLTYKVVYSSSNNISNQNDAEANGTVLMDWTVNALTVNMPSLTPVTTYYIAVLARDTFGNTGINAFSFKTLCTGKIFFLADVSNGNFGGPSGADTLCNANKPAGITSSTFKALLTDGTSRRACYSSGNDNCGLIGTTGRADWVLANSQIYCTSDLTSQIGTTDANGFLTVPVSNVMASSTTTTYTGFNAFWGSSATNCAGFTSTAGTSTVGSATGTENGSTQHTFITSAVPTCTTAGSVYCVEQ